MLLCGLATFRLTQLGLMGSLDIHFLWLLLLLFINFWCSLFFSFFRFVCFAFCLRSMRMISKRELA